MLLLFTIFYIFNNSEQYYKQLQTILYTIETILLNIKNNIVGLKTILNNTATIFATMRQQYC